MYEKEYLRKDGTLVPIELRTVLMSAADGTPQSMWATIRDISERKHTQEALAKSEELCSKVFHNSPQLMTLSELDTGRYLDVNDAFCQISRYPREEAVGRT